MKKLKSLISVLLCAVLVLGMLPVHAHATVEDPQLVLYLHDSYGDGWNDNALILTDSSGNERKITFTSGKDYTETVILDPCGSYILTWEKGKYSSECSFQIEYNGELVWDSGSDCSGYEDGKLIWSDPVGHELDEDSVCATCGKTCGVGFDHKPDESNTCTICGATVTTYAITVAETTNGTVTASLAKAYAGQQVRLTLTATVGCLLDSVTVTDANGEEVEVSDDYTFLMPDSAVTVTAAFYKNNGDFVITGDDGWYVDDSGDLYLTASGDYTIAMKPGVEHSESKIYIDAANLEINLTLDNVSTQLLWNFYPSSKVNLILVGTNKLLAETQFGAPMTISGTGSLEINGLILAGVILNSGTLKVAPQISEYKVSAVYGDVVVNGGTLIVTGADGIHGVESDDGKNGVDGGYGIDGNLTVNGGTVIATGGKGGESGREDGTSGEDGIAVSGMVTIAAGMRYTMQAGESAASAETVFEYAGQKYMNLEVSICEHTFDEDAYCALCRTTCGVDLPHLEENSVCQRCNKVLHTITVVTAFGEVTAPEYAAAGQTVQLEISENIVNLVVTDAEGNPIEVSEDYTFLMPDSAVTVSAKVRLTLTFYMKDSCFDGWNDAALIISDDSGEIRRFAVPDGDGSNTDDITLDPCLSYTVTWLKGRYDAECSFWIEGNGETLKEVAEGGCSDFENGTVLWSVTSAHELDEDGVCATCGKTCGEDFDHKLDENDTCTLCGATVTTYAITVAETTNGTVTASLAKAFAGKPVKLTPVPTTGYVFKMFTVTDANGEEVEVSDDYTFLMPAASVTVTAVFEKNSGDFVVTGSDNWYITNAGNLALTGNGDSYTIAMKDGITGSDAVIYLDEAGDVVDLTLVNVQVATIWDGYRSTTVNVTLVGDNVLQGDSNYNHSYAKAFVISGTGSLTVNTRMEVDVTINGGTLRVLPAYGIGAIVGDVVVNGGTLIAAYSGGAVSGTVTVGENSMIRTFVAGEDADTAADVTAYNGEKYLKLDVLKENTVDMYSLSLTDNVDMNFYAYLSPEAAASAYMVFTIGNRTVTDTESREVAINGVTYRVFSCPTYAKEMSLPVQAQLFWGDGEKSDIYSYSAKQYAQTQLADENASEELKQLLRDMLQYGAYAQKQFAFNTDDLANDGITGAGSIDTVTALPKTLQREGSGSLTLKTISLSLRETVSLNLYFESANGIGGITVQNGGEELALTLAGNGLYSVRIHGIAAKDLDKPVTLTITEESGEPYTVTLTPLTYAAIVLESQQSESLVDLVKSMYLYHTSAAAYFASLNH